MRKELKEGEGNDAISDENIRWHLLVAIDGGRSAVIV